MKNNEYNGSTEYDGTTRFLEIGCKCSCSKMIPRENFAKRFKLSLDLNKTYF